MRLSFGNKLSILYASLIYLFLYMPI
ncbi:MAG: hypothetical protein K0R47_5471, partial [Brevibacillus sp.]|nr:hypothetical protein [Brevibacillus sp.]